jgi:NAD(P)-dependent dehydrogenase (short-subunit alcohol dehydrogenase family)
MKVLITGASSGIGAALAEVYAARGARCDLVARRLAALEIVRLGLVEPDRHRVFEADVRDAPALAAVAQRSMADGEVPDVVIANAGISAGTDTADPRDLAAFGRIVDTNLLGVVATFAPFLAAMKAAPPIEGGRRLVVVASVAGIRGLPGAAAYSASKAAAIAYAEGLRIELRGSGIRVVTLAPGFIATPMTLHNPYRMPFLMPVDRFARRAVDAIASGRSFVVLPWQMAWVARLLRILPDALFDAGASGHGRKPRMPDAP